MTAMRRLLGLIWPRLDPLSVAQVTDKKTRDAKKDGLIHALTLKKQASVALEEARRLADMENERRKTADQKATTYLTFVAAIIPLILTFASALWDKKVGNVPPWINIALLVIALVYTLRAGKWAFEVLKVAASHRLGFSDFDQAWQKSDPITHLTRSILQTVRLNEDGTNRKVSGIKMTHAFLFRSFVSFFLLLVVNILWPMIDALAAQQNLWRFFHEPTVKASSHPPPASITPRDAHSSVGGRPPVSPSRPNPYPHP
jgi:hypothetical protein